MTTIKQIVSKKDPLIQEVLRLKKEQEVPFYFAEGIRAVETISQQSEKIIEHIFVTDTAWLQQIKKQLLSKCILVSDHIMDALSQVKTAPGIIALCKYQFKTGVPKTPGLVCYNISDPGNLGTLFRSAAAFGAKSVICIGGVNPLHPKVIQASTGTINAIAIHKMSESLFFESVPKNSTIVALTATQAKDISTIEIIKNALVVVGNEAHGLPKQFVDRCSFSVNISMKGSTESLNAAIAGAIAMYELF
jgi:RNA methyltransferase, TrmH family